MFLKGNCEFPLNKKSLSIRHPVSGLEPEVQEKQILSIGKDQIKPPDSNKDFLSAQGAPKPSFVVPTRPLVGVSSNSFREESERKLRKRAIGDRFQGCSTIRPLQQLDKQKKRSTHGVTSKEISVHISIISLNGRKHTVFVHLAAACRLSKELPEQNREKANAPSQE